jgi:cytidylate kinase
VLDGRDIGSVVCPHAQVKLFVTADPGVRAQRRLDELRAGGRVAIYQDVLQELNERDARDAERQAAPLSAAPDAVILDTTALDAEMAFARASDIVERALAGWR